MSANWREAGPSGLPGFTETSRHGPTYWNPDVMSFDEYEVYGQEIAKRVGGDANWKIEFQKQLEAIFQVGGFKKDEVLAEWLRRYEESATTPEENKANKAAEDLKKKIEGWYGIEDTRMTGGRGLLTIPRVKKRHLKTFLGE